MEDIDWGKLVDDWGSSSSVKEQQTVTHLSMQTVQVRGLVQYKLLMLKHVIQ